MVYFFFFSSFDLSSGDGYVPTDLLPTMAILRCLGAGMLLEGGAGVGFGSLGARELAERDARMDVGGLRREEEERESSWGELESWRVESKEQREQGSCGSGEGRRKSC